MNGEINWLDKVASWGWMAVSAAAVALGGGYIKLWRQHDRHDARIAALEQQFAMRQRETAEEFERVRQTVDNNRAELGRKIEGAAEDIKRDLREIRGAMMAGVRQG